MPELPEVETIRRALAPHMEGRTLEDLEILDPRWCMPLETRHVADALRGRAIERLDRRGKYLIVDLEDEAYLMVHLRMTGNLLLERGRFPRVRFDLGERELWFDDPRRFGTGELALGHDEREAFLNARLGLEPLDPHFTADHLHQLARRCKAPIKAMLLDQKRIAGVGNIYADEALFRAKLHPLKPADRLTRKEATVLHQAVVDSLNAGIEAKGATIDDFRDPYGVQGSFQDRFLVHTRAGEPCPQCGTAITKLRAAGRGTYVCPRCQRPPRATAVRRRSRPGP